MLTKLPVVLVRAESVGGGAGTIQEPDDDGVHDVDGWEHRPPVQHRHHLLRSVAAHKRTPIRWERYCLEASGFSVLVANLAEGIANSVLLLDPLIEHFRYMF